MNIRRFYDRLGGEVWYYIDTTKGTTPSEIKRQGQEPGKKEVTTMTNMNAAATTSYNAAAQNIKVNRKMRTLEISKTFEKAASRYGSDEYIALMHAQMENPGYSVKVVTRKGGSKQPYAGLTFEYMKKYISMHDI